MTALPTVPAALPHLGRGEQGNARLMALRVFAEHYTTLTPEHEYADAVRIVTDGPRTEEFKTAFLSTLARLAAAVDPGSPA